MYLGFREDRNTNLQHPICHSP